MIILIGVLLGIVAGLAVNFHVPETYTHFIAVAILAAFDSIFGGFHAALRKSFKVDMFLTGLLGNAVLSAFLVFIGQKLDIDLSIAAVIVFGTRIFKNFSNIRRLLLNKSKKRDTI